MSRNRKEIDLLNISEEIYNYNKELQDLQYYYNEIDNKKKRIELKKGTLKTKKNEILECIYCPICKRIINEDLKLKLIKGYNRRIEEINGSLEEIIEELQSQKETINYIKKLRENLLKEREKLRE